MLTLKKRVRVSLETVSVSLAFGIGSMFWKVDTTQKKAAWSLYVELVTRIAVQPLEVDQGLVREAMNIQGLSLEQLENLGEALLDFSSVADLETWLNQQSI